jgi:hypothetical protein
MSKIQPPNNASGADNPQGSLTTAERSWLAGLFDGDGWIGLTRAKRTGSKQNRYSAQTIVTTTSDRIADRVLDLYAKAGVGVNVKEFPVTYNEEREQWHARKWNIRTASNTQTLAVLRIIHPYLVEKKTLSAILIEYITWRQSLPHRTGASKSLYEQIQQRGEDAVARMKEDRWRNDPSETARLAPSKEG